METKAEEVAVEEIGRGNENEGSASFRGRELPGQDSNLEKQDQNLL
jgi:hypothetical protein